MSPTLPQRPLRVQSDARLLQLARRGETAAFEALVRRYRRQLHGYCRRFGLGDAQAEDALQQGLLHAWRGLCRGDDVRDVKSWMYRIVHNAAHDVLRRPGSDNVELDEGVHGHLEVSAAGELDRRLTVQATLTELAALPDMQREALVRTAVHGDSHEQVASSLGLSDAAVRGLVHRARIAMRAAAGALVPQRLLHWLVRSGAGAGVVGPSELGAGPTGGDGILAVLAKGVAILATGGVLAGGLVAVEQGHRRLVGGRPESASAASPGRAPGFPSATSGAVAGKDSLLPTIGRPKGGTAPSAHGPQMHVRRGPAGRLRRIDLPSGSAPTAALPQTHARGASSTGQSGPVDMPPHGYGGGGAEQSAPTIPHTQSAPSGSVGKESAHTNHPNEESPAQGGGVSGGASGSKPEQSAGGGQTSGVAKHGGAGGEGIGGERSGGNSANAHAADRSGGVGNAGGAGNASTHSGRSEAGESGGGTHEPSEGTRSTGAEHGNAAQAQAQTPGTNGAGSGGSRESPKGGSSQHHS